jgi:zinc transport system substrate-binding protein
MKLRIIIIFILLLCLLFVSCSAQQESLDLENGKINVVTTIFVEYDFVREIASDHVNVDVLLPPGADLHGFEPTPKDIINIQNSDMVIYVGGPSDVWMDDILDAMDMSGLSIIKLTECVDLKDEELKEGMQEVEHDHSHDDNDEAEVETNEDHDEVENEDHVEADHEDHKGEAHEHDHEFDEHVWTSPKNVMGIVKSIADELSTLDPVHADEYKKNLDAYTKELLYLDEAFSDVVEKADRKTVVFADRFPVRYFVEEYGLDYWAAFPGCAGETEPSAATMSFLINKVEQEGIPVVFKIELSNGNIARSIGEATGAEVRTFYTCHNVTKEDFDNGETYLSMMKKNVSLLKEALN